MTKATTRDPFRLPQPDGVRETQAAQAYHAIRAMILRCELEPGSVINDRLLGERLDYGRTPIREALLRLSGERLILFQSNHSIVVAPVDLDQINHLYTLRLHLERLAWRLWVEAASDHQIEKLARIFDSVPRLVEADNVEGLLHLDFLFHAQIYNECGNPFLTQSLYSLSGLTYRIWFITNRRDVNAQAATALSHAPIIAAVRNRDATTLDREIEKHIRHAYDDIMEQFINKTVNRIGDIPVQPLKKGTLNGTDGREENPNEAASPNGAVFGD